MSKNAPIRVTVLLSGSGSTFAAIQQFAEQQQINFRITDVLSDNPEAYGLKRAQLAGIANGVIDFKQYDERQDFDMELLEAVKQCQPDLVVLAGYMRIVDTQFVANFNGKLLNIHPSLLPKYPGLNTYQRAIDDQEKTHGSTVHFVNEVLDGGALIAQAIVNIDENDTVETLSARVQLAERRMYPIVINWFANERLELRNATAFLDGQPLNQPRIIDGP